MTAFFEQSRKPDRSAGVSFPAVRAIGLERDGDEILSALRDLLPEAQTFARTPVSHFPVGAAALGESGRVWLGANMEFPGLPLNFTVHAEQAALINARQNGETRILCLAVSAAPCGYCRQFLLELGTPLPVLIGSRLTSLEELLPEAFRLEKEAQGGLLGKQDLSSLRPCGDRLADLACAAALKSYSPYTRSPSGAALRCASGRVFCGSLAESSAYNPTLTPLQTALIIRSLAGAHEDPIAEAVLAESSSAAVSQAPAFEMMIKKLAPQAAFRVIEQEGL